MKRISTPKIPSLATQLHNEDELALIADYRRLPLALKPKVKMVVAEQGLLQNLVLRPRDEGG
jgi:hypothetical protein